MTKPTTATLDRAFLAGHSAARSSGAPASPANPTRVRSALAFLDPHNRKTWVAMAFAVREGLGDDGFDIWSEWGAQHKRPAGEVKSTWKSATPRAGGIGIGTLFYDAKNAGWKDDDKYPKPTKAEIAKREAAAAARRAQLEAEEAAEQEAAAKLAQELWSEAEDCADHPYLTRKAVKSYGLKYGPYEVERTDDQTGEITKVRMKALLVPLYDRKRKLWSLQAISAKAGGKKLILADSKKSGNFFPVGTKPLERDGRKVFVLGEGYATCATLHEATGHMVLMCVDTSGLLPVAQALRERDPNAIILLAADNDQWNANGNPGVEAATKAAAAVDGLVAIPPFEPSDAWGKDDKGRPTGPTDWNDFAGMNDLQMVAGLIEKALAGAVPLDIGEVDLDCVLLVPSRDEVMGIIYAHEALAQLDAAISRLDGASANLSVPVVVPYDGQLERATGLVRKLLPGSTVRILAAPGDVDEARRVAAEYGAAVDEPPTAGGWQGWGEHFLDMLFSYIDSAAADAGPTQAAASQTLVQAAGAGGGAGQGEVVVSKHAQDVAKTIERKLTKAFKLDPGAPDYRHQIDAFGINPEVIDRMVSGSFWSGGKSKLFFLNDDQALNQYTAGDAHKFLVRGFGYPVDAGVIEAATDAAAADPGMSKGDANALRKAVSEAVSGPILDHLKYENQRDSIEWRTDMFASQARMQLSEDKARIVLTHKPFDAPGTYEQEIVDDYKRHFTRFDEFLEFLVMSRFAMDRKKCYLWLLADSDWGKGFLLGVLKGLGLAVETSMKEVESMFEGKPVGRSPEEFKRAFALVVDEFKTVKSELKQLQSEITLSPKHQLTASVEVFAKMFLSAESVGSLVTSHGIEDQFANRMSIFQETGSLDQRPLFNEVGKPRYFNSVLAYTAETMNQMVEKMQKMGRVEAQTYAERWINGFIARNGLDTLYSRFSESLPQMAAEALPWVFQQKDYLLHEGNGPETRYYLKSAGKVLDDYLNEHFDASEAPGYRKKKAEILRLMSADGRGVRTHRINGLPTNAVLLMKSGSTANDLVAKKQ